MSLQDELDAVRAAFISKAPPGRDALYEAKVQELRATFPVGNALAAGDRAPDFTLPAALGQAVTLSDRLRHGPVVAVFYRGGWCPYCNVQLRAYQKILDAIQALGGQMLAISPQTPDGSVSTRELNALGYDVLSDAGNNVARSFGLVYALPEELRTALRSNDKDLAVINGDDSWELPLPATYVIAPDRRLVLAEIELDYRRRLEPDSVLAALRGLRAGTTRAA
jgi:peroxiredoxin